jgi:NitT/TauT family transport system substrate-binding protein
MMTLLRVGVLAAGLLLALIANVRAEVKEITLAQQYGVSLQPLMPMEKQAQVEQHAAATALTKLKVSWAKLAGPSATNDGLISGSIQFAAQGAPSPIRLSDKTRGQIKELAAMTTAPSTSRNRQVMAVKGPTRTRSPFHRSRSRPGRSC